MNARYPVAPSRGTELSALEGSMESSDYQLARAAAPLKSTVSGRSPALPRRLTAPRQVTTPARPTGSPASQPAARPLRWSIFNRRSPIREGSVFTRRPARGVTFRPAKRGASSIGLDSEKTKNAVKEGSHRSMARLGGLRDTRSGRGPDARGPTEVPHPKSRALLASRQHGTEAAPAWGTLRSAKVGHI